jgi:hypothetical protein
MSDSSDPVLAPISGAEYREIGGIGVDTVCVGEARVKRMVYPPGFRWSTHIKPIVGTDFCMHAHVGFLARGQLRVEYSDGCTVELTAPAVVAIEPEHDAWIVGETPAVLIEFDFGNSTVGRMGMPDAHRHG